MTTTGTTSAPLGMAERIGPYRLLQVLGEGGMGIVYEAEETEPVRRRVALKVVRDRHASKEVIARFEIERQALAVMNHPGIAKVFSAGTTASGQPYFAMELVRGLPITQYCDEHRLSIRQRLELFVAVCNAVQHAHQKGVIHRDLKPSNILITEADGVPEPRVIDFGIAKALGQQLTDLTLITQLGHAIGTAAYMSPEQAESSGTDVDTRADIYSLGVLMYEVLVGELPTDPSAIGIHAYLARLMARESDPQTPSARLDSLRLDPTVVAKARRTDIGHLRRQMRGDLDWIVMKAMDPDRSRRYATANGLAMDIQRYLANEPVIARPPSTLYRLGKFVRRHRTATIGATLGIAAIAASSIFTTIGMVRATRAERVAEREAIAARQVTSFLVDIFRVASPFDTAGGTLDARAILDRGAARASTTLGEQPELLSRLQHTIGTVYASLGLFPQARTLLEEALRSRERLYGSSDTLVAETLVQLGGVAINREEFGEAERHLERALRIVDAELEPPHPRIAEAVSELGVLRMRERKLAAAESLFLRSISITDRLPQGAVARPGRDLMLLGAVYLSLERHDAAEPILRRALTIQERTLGPDHPAVAATSGNLGIVYWTRKDYRQALPVYQKARQILEATYPREHPSVAQINNNIAETYWKLGRHAEAEVLFRKVLDIKERTMTAGAPGIAVTLHGLAGVLRDQGRHAEAEPYYVRALEIRRRAHGPDDLSVADTRRDYAAMLRASGRMAEANAMEP